MKMATGITRGNNNGELVEGDLVVIQINHIVERGHSCKISGCWQLDWISKKNILKFLSPNGSTFLFSNTVIYFKLLRFFLYIPEYSKYDSYFRSIKNLLDDIPYQISSTIKFCPPSLRIHTNVNDNIPTLVVPCISQSTMPHTGLHRVCWNRCIIYSS